MKLSELYVGGEPQIVIALKKITDDKRRAYCKIEKDDFEADKTAINEIFEKMTKFTIVSVTDKAEDLLNTGNLINYKMLRKMEPVKEKIIEGHDGVFMRLSKEIIGTVIKENFKALADYFHKTIGSEDGLEEAASDPFRSRELLKRMVSENQGMYVAEKNAEGKFCVNTFDEWLDITKMSLPDDCGGYVYELIAIYAYKRDEETVKRAKEVDMLAVHGVPEEKITVDEGCEGDDDECDEYDEDDDYDEEDEEESE